MSDSSARGPGWFAVLFIALTCSFAAVALFYWALARGLLPAPGLAFAPPPAPATSAPGPVKVPELSGLPLATAGELLEARGLRLVVREERAQAGVAAGAVAAQEPLAGSSLERAAQVSVVVSRGAPSELLLPDLRGQTLAEARTTLERAGLVVGPVAGPEDGVVRGSQPPGGQPLAPGAMVGLSLEPGGREVPKVVGLGLSRAKEALVQAGFVVGKVRERFVEERDPGVVLEQSLPPGERAAAGSAVDLVRNETY